MRIPKVLTKLRNTWPWRHKWKILAIAPFALSILVYGCYATYDHLAKRQYEHFVESWLGHGESFKAEELLPAAPLADDDVFLHPAVLDEINQSHPLELNGPPRIEIPGFSTNSQDYLNHPRGDWRIGMESDITHWLATNGSRPGTSASRSRGRRGRRSSSPPPSPATPARPAVLSEQATAIACLKHLAPFDQRILALRQAFQRPTAYFPPATDPMDFNAIGMKQHNLLVQTSHLLSKRALLHIKARHPEQAAADIRHLMRGYHLHQDSHSLIGYLFSISHFRSVGLPLWHGLKNQLWDDATLASLDQQFAGIDEPKRLLHHLRQEICYSHYIATKHFEDPHYIENQQNRAMASLGSSFGSSSSWDDILDDLLEDTVLLATPNGLIINQLTWSLECQKNIVFYPGGQRTERVDIDQAVRLHATRAPWSHFNTSLMGDNSMSWLARQIEKSLQAQAEANNMRTAIALERYRLKHQQYPHTLEQLVPAYLPEVPEDVITGKPLNYQLKDDGTPLVYSVGANQKDDHGRPHRSPDNGDWSWMYSPPKAFTYDDFLKSHP